MIKKSYILVFCMLLGACGFHLRGYNNTDFKFPFQTIYIECNNVIICSNFNNIVKTDDLATISTNPESAEVTIRLLNEETSRDAQGFNAVGRISAYVLTYQVQAQVWQHHEQIGNTINISAQSVMQYNDATIRSNEIGEADFWDRLHQNATNQLARRLVYFKYRNYSIDEPTESK
jgi:LPS-assembly lipoprotein